jgi:hypothetical protein
MVGATDQSAHVFLAVFEPPVHKFEFGPSLLEDLVLKSREGYERTQLGGGHQMKDLFLP